LQRINWIGVSLVKEKSQTFEEQEEREDRAATEEGKTFI
jgi:hypothetical protein